MVGRERRRKAPAFRGTLQNVNVPLRGSSGVFDWPEFILDCCLCLRDFFLFYRVPVAIFLRTRTAVVLRQYYSTVYEYLLL